MFTLVHNECNWSITNSLPHLVSVLNVFLQKFETSSQNLVS